MPRRRAGLAGATRNQARARLQIDNRAAPARPLSTARHHARGPEPRNPLSERNPMRRLLINTVFLVAPLAILPPATAQATIECWSRDYRYNECYAGELSRPQLIHQISGSACIVNRTWGYNPRSGYIWVSEGCSGTFADVGGYHHGRGDTYDEGARHYDARGRDAGALIGGLVLGAILGSAASDDDHERRRPRDSGYDGCHGSGCLVTSPDDPPEPGQLEMQ